jgi:hypothetical protein
METKRGSRGISVLYWVVNATSRLLYHREIDPVPIVKEVGWADLGGFGKSRPHRDSIAGTSIP